MSTTTRLARSATNRRTIPSPIAAGGTGDKRDLTIESIAHMLSVLVTLK
jgi:hypothetical protein